MQKLYMIRRNLESYLGPTDIQGLKELYKKMECGLQDEVAGSCGVWIALDDISKLKKVYPDLARVVHEDFLGGWAGSIQSEDRPLRAKKNQKKLKSKERRGRSSNGLVLGFAGILFVVGLTMIVLARGGNRITDFFNYGSKSDLESLARALEAEDFSSIDRTVERRLSDIVPRLSRSRGVYNDWIPYVRSYAFRRNGEVEGLPFKFLRGMGNQAAPQDCSLTAWGKTFPTDPKEFVEIAEGRKASDALWLRAAMWDSFWMARRTKDPQWRDPKNFFDACLRMGHRFMNESRPYPDDEQAKKVWDALTQRYRFQLAQISGQASYEASDVKVSFVTLSCLEAKVLGSESSCEVPTNLVEPVQASLDQASLRLETYILVRSGPLLTDDTVAALSKIVGQLKNKDPLTGLDFSAELKFVGLLARPDTSLEDAERQVAFEYQDVDFSH